MDAWRPTASWPNLRERAKLLAKLRRFFSERGVMEVDVPLLGRHTASAPALRSLSVHDGDAPLGYLQTSPEHAMKRLLAAGSGPIYQLGKAFRAGERGRRHLTEFTLLEWYRPGWRSAQLMDEVAALLREVAGARDAPRHYRYRELFQSHLGLNPHRASAAAAREAAARHLGEVADSAERDDWLGLLFDARIAPTLDAQAPCFVRDFPASQAELAQLVCDPAGTLVADRFELYWRGVELANGYGELRDPEAQRRRFERDRQRRQDSGQAALAADPQLAGALAAGLPACAGVALGVDRLLMLMLGAERIDMVVPFTLN